MHDDGARRIVIRELTRVECSYEDVQSILSWPAEQELEPTMPDVGREHRDGKKMLPPGLPPRVIPPKDEQGEDDNTDEEEEDPELREMSLVLDTLCVCGQVCVARW